MYTGKITKLLPKLPNTPGVYLFYNQEKDLVYVGKATSLRSRVRSYFYGLRAPRPIEEMIHEVQDIKWKETDSALEAIILEANYIKKFLPKYNVIGKDNKSWNYIVITRDEFPKVETVRQHEYGQLSAKQIKQFKHVFGPYPGLNTKAAMKILRRIFHFFNCNPPNDKSPRPCLYNQIGLCPGICAGVIMPREYKERMVRPLVMFLQGKKKQVMRLLTHAMRQAGKAENFEEAARIRDQLNHLQRIQDVALLNKSFVDWTPDSRLQTAATNGSAVVRSPLAVDQPFRIEGYDISNIGATEKVGSMVVFDEYGPVKSEYRKFIIRTVPGQSDVDCLAEMLERRLRHPEWPLPTVFLIDGGRPQVNAVKKIVETQNFASVRRIPVVGIAKGPERKRNDVILGNKDPKFIKWVDRHKELLISARDEAHRFAVTFHRKRRSRQFLGR